MATLTIGKDPVQITLSGHTMGSDYAIKYINWADGTPQPAPETLKAAIDDRLQQVNDEMSTYIPNSHISRINQLRDTESHTPLPRDFAHVFQAALRINRITQGGLDVTLGALVNAWGFGPEPRGALPDAEETARRAAAVGMDKFELQQQGDATLLRKKHPDLYLDLSSIAKGFGVDAVAQVLEDAGIPDYLVEIGGEIRSAGKSPAGEPWRIAIEHPEPPHHPHLIIALPHHGLATSGGYRNFRQDENGNTHTHLINPRTLQPVHNSIASLSVIARTSMEADGLATGLTTLGAADALALARQEHLAVCIIERRDGALHTAYTDEFAAFIQPK